MARLTARHQAEFGAIRDLCHRGLDSAPLRERVGDRLARHLGAPSYCFGSTDAATGLPVHSISVGLDPAAMKAFFGLVAATPSLDFGPWVDQRRRVSRLADLVDDVDRDPYTTEILRPSGLRYDIQVSCAADGWSWGHLCLRREPGAGDFTADEARFLSCLVPHLTAGLRAAATRAAQGAAPATATGVVVLGPDGTVELASGEAERLFRQPVSGTRHCFLSAVHVVAARLERTLQQDPAGAGTDPDLPTLLFVDETSRTTYRLRAQRATGADGRPRGLVMIEPATGAAPSDQMQRLAQFGLSRRECEVAVAVLRGRATAEIATAMHLSAHTVQDHVGRVFDKVGVASRQQLAVRLLGG